MKNPFPEAIVEVVQPLFDRLGDETFLAGCENCYTQNRNESLHHVIWGKASKDVYSSPQEISIARSLGVLEFNHGFHRTYSELLPVLGIGAEKRGSELMKRGSIKLIIAIPRTLNLEERKRGKRN